MDKFDFSTSFPCDINRSYANSLSNKLSKFNSDIYISKADDYRKYSAKSSLALISIDINKSDKIDVEVYGNKNEYENIKTVFELYS